MVRLGCMGYRKVVNNVLYPTVLNEKEVEGFSRLGQIKPAYRAGRLKRPSIKSLAGKVSCDQLSLVHILCAGHSPLAALPLFTSFSYALQDVDPTSRDRQYRHRRPVASWKVPSTKQPCYNKHNEHNKSLTIGKYTIQPIFQECHPTNQPWRHTSALKCAAYPPDYVIYNKHVSWVAIFACFQHHEPVQDFCADM